MVATPNTALSQIHMQIMWSRLIAVVEEQAQTLMRTAFSTSVREAGDLSAGVFDRQGRMLAQAVTGTPGHVNSMATGVKHFLAVYPIDSMREGDHYLTNDPWLTSGHLHDITVVTPTFKDGRPIALFANTIHVVDIGGLGMGPDGRQVYEEGLALPIMPLARQGEFNQDLLSIVRANVREPFQVEGDIFACAACNEEGGRRLLDMLGEFRLADVEALGDQIIEASRQATLNAIRKLKPGVYKNSLTMDGYDKPLTLSATMTIGYDGIHVDYSGTSPASAYGINVVLNYCTAYTAFGVRVLVAPEVPNNAGSLETITVSAPEGSVLNVKRPWAVAARHTVGHMLPDVVFGCLHQVIKGGVPAEGASSLWNPQIYGGGSMVDEVEEGVDPSTLPQFSTVIFHCGGSGARPSKDGLDVTAFPSGVRTIPVEATETVAPIVFWRREFREEFGRGGCDARRARPGHRDRRCRRHAGEPALQLRAREEPRARAQRRQERRARPSEPRLRPADPAQGPPDGAAARPHPARAAGGWRLRAAGDARSGARGGRRDRRHRLARECGEDLQSSAHGGRCGGLGAHASVARRRLS